MLKYLVYITVTIPVRQIMIREHHEQGIKGVIILSCSMSTQIFFTDTPISINSELFGMQIAQKHYFILNKH